MNREVEKGEDALYLTMPCIEKSLSKLRKGDQSMIKKIIISTFACSSTVLPSVFLGYQAGYAYTQGPSFQASGYGIDMGAPLANTVSLAAQASIEWASALSWTFFSLSLLAAVALVLWACLSSSASLLPKLPGTKRPEADRLSYWISVDSIGNAARRIPSSISTGAYGLPRLFRSHFPAAR
jgi:hypothetical protein